MVTRTEACSFLAVTLCSTGLSLFGMYGTMYAGDSAVQVWPFSPALALASLVAFLVAPRVGRLSDHRWAVPVAVGGMFCGAFLASAFAGTPFLDVAALAGYLLLAFCSLAIIVLWFETMLSPSSLSLRVIVVFATLTGIAISYFVPFTTAAALYAGAALNAVAAALFLTLPAGEGPASRAVAKRELSFRPQTVVGVVIVAFAGHLVSYATTPEGNPFSGTVAVCCLLCGVVLWACMLWRDDPSHANLVRCIALAVFAAYVLQVAPPQADWLVLGACGVAGTLIWVGVIAAALEICTYATTPPLRIIGGALFLLTGVSLVTTAFSFAAPEAIAALSSPLFCKIMVLVVVAVGLWLLNANELNLLFWGTPATVEPGLSSSGKAEESGTHAQPESRPDVESCVSIQSRQEALRHLARDAGLSRREEEVFDLLAAGRSAPFIAETLYVETSTAKSHIARIYSKLGVHTRQELLNLVEDARAGQE